MTAAIQKFPRRLGGPRVTIAVTLPEPMGGNAKIYLRDIAKRCPAYRQPIETDIAGRADDGKSIPIDTIGKWLFGVPGYQGHIVVSNWDGRLAEVEVPAESPQIVFDLIEEIKRRVEEGTWRKEHDNDE